MEFGIHLPLMQFDDVEVSAARVAEAVDAARECGFATVSANDHFVFSTPWLDGPTALASVIDRSGDMTLATTVTLAALRGPVELAKALAALDILSGGRLVAGVGPGSSQRDYEALGIPFDERWKRFDESIAALRALLEGLPPPAAQFARLPSHLKLEPAPRRRVPLWIGSWGSEAGVRRVARSADGWLASAYNTTPEGFAEARSRLGHDLAARGRDGEGFPNALATMWTWIAEDESEGERVLAKVLAPLLRREPDALRDRVCVGSPDHCADILSRYARAGCQRVYFWPLRDERRQIELLATEVAPRLTEA